MRLHHLGLALGAILLSLLAPVSAQASSAVVDDYGYQDNWVYWGGSEVTDVTSYADQIFGSGIGHATGQTLGMFIQYDVDGPGSLSLGARSYAAGLGGEGYKYLGSTAGTFGVLRAGIRLESYTDTNTQAWVTRDSLAGANIWESAVGPSSGANKFNDVAVIGEGIFAAGSFGSKLAVSKLNYDTGAATKTRSWGSGSIGALARVGPNLFAAGISSGQAVLIKLNPTTLAPIWTKKLGPVGTGGTVKMVAMSGGLVVAAQSSKTWAGKPKGGSDVVVGRWSTSGARSWVTRVGTSGADPLADLIWTPHGPVVAGPDWVQGLSPGGARLWDRTLSATAGNVWIGAGTWSGGLVLLGTTSGNLFGPPASTTDLFRLRWQVHQPDVSVKAPGSKRFVGAGVWEIAEQTGSVTLKRGRSATYAVRVGNGGDPVEQFSVAGCDDSNGLTYRYFSGSTNITAAVVGGTFNTGLIDPTPSAYVDLRVKVTAAKKAPRTTTTCSVSAYSPGLLAVFDSVGLRTSVR